MARILVADDERGILDVMERVLTRRGHDVETFDDGTSAVDAVEQGDYDLVITDLRMPGATGLDVLAASKRRRRATPVVLVSGATEAEDRARAEALGVHVILHKPVDLAYLTSVIDGAIGVGATSSAGASGLVKIIACEPVLTGLLSFCLKRDGFEVTTEAGATVVIAGDPAVVEAARGEDPKAFVIVLYPEAGRDAAVRALDRGADVAIPMPFDPDLLFAHVRAALRHGAASRSVHPERSAGGAGAESKEPAPEARNRIANVKLKQER